MARVARVLELGAQGVGRRLRWRAEAGARARRAAAWHEAAAEPPSAPLPRPGDILAGAPFFLDAGDATLPAAFRARHPAALEALLGQADSALRGDLGFVVPGGTPDWHRALPGDGRWPLAEAAATEAAIGAAVPSGDVRLAWEVGRGTHLVRLAQAAWLTGERRYGDAARAGLEDFMEANPPGRGIAWLHAQEVGLRAVAWLWVLRLLRGSSALDDEATGRVLAQLRLHGGFVEAFRSDGPVTHNHLVSEAAALCVLGGALPWLAEALRWRRLGRGILARELRKQVHEDGASGEGSTHYHAFVLDSCLSALLLGERGGAQLPAAARERVARMAELVRWLVRSDGTLPAIGDSDAGRAFRLAHDPLDRRDALAAAAVAFGRPDWGAVAGDAPGAFWLSGGRPVPGAGAPAPAGGARAFRAAGLAVARTGYGAEEEIVVFRGGAERFLPDVLTAHHHSDALSVLLRAGGEDVLLDPGTYLYSEGEGWRAALRGAAAHSCVILDGADQADVTSARFGIAGLRAARWLGFEGGARYLAAEAEHPAEGTPRVRRRMVWLAGGCLVFCDDVLGSGLHGVEAWFSLPETQGEVRGHAAELRLASGRAVRIQALAGAREVRLLRPAPGPGPGWYAPRYGVIRAGSRVAVSAGKLLLPCRLLTVVQTAAAPAGLAVPRLEADAAGAARVHIGGTAITFPAPGGIHLEGPEAGGS